jgi:hypothetical protein
MGFFLFWIAASASVAVVTTGFSWKPGGCVARALVVACFILGAGNLKKLYSTPGCDVGMHPFPCTSYSLKQLPCGDGVYYPADGGLPYDAPLPCTLSLRADLQFRDPNNIAAGFRTKPVMLSEREPTFR